MQRPGRDARAVIPSGPASISAPSARNAATWKSTGRRPIGSPPTSGTNASPVRCSSGPSIRIGIRFSPVNAAGTRDSSLPFGAMVISPPDRLTPKPTASSIAAVMSTSPTSGAFLIVLGPSPSIAATMCLVTAFFDPRTPISPRSGPDGSTCHVSVTLTTVGAPPVRSAQFTSPPPPRGDRDNSEKTLVTDSMRVRYRGSARGGAGLRLWPPDA